MAKHKKKTPRKPDRKLLGTAPGPLAVAPYAEEAVVWESVPAEITQPPYREFMQTDARTVMLILAPNHWNFFPNPCLRNFTDGWEATGFSPNPSSILETYNCTEDGSENRTALEAINARLLEGQVVEARYRGESTYLIKVEGGAVNILPFPSDQALSDYRVWKAVPDDGDPDSWVGKSLVLNGSGTVRYRQPSSTGDHFVYVGALSDEEEDRLRPDTHGRGSSQWRFSAYFKGQGSVRMSMRAYNRIEEYLPGPNEYLPPPSYYDAPVVGPETSPDSWPYGEDGFVVRNADGSEMVWESKNPPFYTNLGPCNASKLPSTISPLDTMPQILEQNAPGTADHQSVWEKIQTFKVPGPYYIKWGIPTEHDDPSGLSAGGSGKYVRKTGTGDLYVTSTSGYVPVASEKDRDPGSVLPDYSSIPDIVVYGGNVWTYNRIPATSPWNFYTLAGSVSDTTDLDPETMPPDMSKKYIRTESQDLWVRNPPPYYYPTGNPPYFASTTSQWTTVDREDDWTRLSVRTGRTEGTSATTVVHFSGAWWIDTVIEIRDAVDLKVSSFMLDPNEFPFAEYFDGGMSDNQFVTDYRWEDGIDPKPDNSPSFYIYQLATRLEWTHDNLRYVTPFGRPYQIFLGSTRHPFVPESYESNMTPPGADRFVV